MASVTHPHFPSSLRRLFARALSSLHGLVTWSKRGGRAAGRRPVPYWEQRHFGSLDDQLLSDLGLQRSEIRAAEYGILPGDQALHHEDDAAPRKDEASDDPVCQPRSGA